MAVFEHCSMLLELKTLPFKEKNKLKSAITENGGQICYVVNKQCSLIVTGDVSDLSSNRLRGIQKHRTPVVGVDYVYSCLERGLLLPVDDYKLDVSPPADFSPPLPPSSTTLRPLTSQEFKVPAAEPTKGPAKGPTKPVDPVGPAKPVDSVGPGQRAASGEVREKYRIYTEADSDLPAYPENFQVAKYSIFEKVKSNTWCVLELQSHRGEAAWQYRVVKYWKDNIATKAAAAAAARVTLVFLSTSEEALEVYKAQRETLQAAGLQLRTHTPPQAPHLGSAPLQQLLLEEKLNAGSLTQEVGVFVELLWTEALGRLGNILRVPIDKLSLNDVSRVEGLLLQAQRKLKEANPFEAASLLDEVYTLLPHTAPPHRPPTAKLISQKLDLCQLIRDVLNVSEMNLRRLVPSSLGKYRALRCSIETVPSNTSEFRAVTAPLLKDRRVQVRQLLRVSRGVELQTFRSEVGNVKPLLHSSSPSNFVGVLSRGLLLPRVGVMHHGIERTDAGHLGSGIYFSDAVSASLKYSTPSEMDGSRLLLVCDVALGRCSDVHKRDVTLTQAPEGHHSTHGVRHTPSAHSEFEDDEYVVYSPDQVKLKYVVRFSLQGEQLKEFSPAIDASAEPAPPPSDQGREVTLEDDEVESIKNPLADVKAGLLDSSGQQLPLQAVHVKCRLMDLLSQVIIFQKYTNRSAVPIEAKYVFPLDDAAAVCGFEAFINGKHVVGQVKEKETARKEYKQAIEKGHGAYLMDQDAPDVFTISVGNLPPGATVLIKVTFVSELIVRDGSILFSLPGSVAPWQESAALNQTTQVTVDKVCVTDEAREFTLDVSVEMPNKITDLRSVTHKVKVKRTDCKAVVSVLPGEVMGQDGFQLSITLSEVHLPRMWVEKHPDKDSQASMLVFYPDFEVDSTSACDEVVLLVDTSESMKGAPLRAAQTIARQVLKTLDRNLRLNVVFFGTDHTEAFLTARPLAEARPAAESFLRLSSPVGGGTELWRPLRALSLLPPSRGVRNLLLLSDGHVQNAELALQLLRDNARHSRLFTCGLSPTANRHMLRALAQAGGGAFEYFDTKTKHNWAEKVARQLKRMASPGCSSVSVKWQQFNPTAPPPVQAPRQLHALFNDCHTLVYGFVPHCTQATLLGHLSGQELKTMVSTSELQKTKGTFLHKLTARALIRDYEDGSLDSNEAEHEGQKAELKRSIIELSKEFSILSRFTSFVAIEERDSERTEEGFTDIPKLISEEDVDFLPYVGWISPQEGEEEEPMDVDGTYFTEEVYDDVELQADYSSCALLDYEDYEEEEEEEECAEEEEADEEAASSEGDEGEGDCAEEEDDDEGDDDGEGGDDDDDDDWEECAEEEEADEEAASPEDMSCALLVDEGEGERAEEEDDDEGDDDGEGGDEGDDDDDDDWEECAEDDEEDDDDDGDMGLDDAEREIVSKIEPKSASSSAHRRPIRGPFSTSASSSFMKRTIEKKTSTLECRQLSDTEEEDDVVEDQAGFTSRFSMRKSVSHSHQASSPAYLATSASSSFMKRTVGKKKSTLECRQLSDTDDKDDDAEEQTEDGSYSMMGKSVSHMRPMSASSARRSHFRGPLKAQGIDMLSSVGAPREELCPPPHPFQVFPEQSQPSAQSFHPPPPPPPSIQVFGQPQLSAQSFHAPPSSSFHSCSLNGPPPKQHLGSAKLDPVWGFPISGLPPINQPERGSAFGSRGILPLFGSVGDIETAPSGNPLQFRSGSIKEKSFLRSMEVSETPSLKVLPECKTVYSADALSGDLLTEEASLDSEKTLRPEGSIFGSQSKSVFISNKNLISDSMQLEQSSLPTFQENAMMQGRPSSGFSFGGSLFGPQSQGRDPPMRLGRSISPFPETNNALSSGIASETNTSSSFSALFGFMMGETPFQSPSARLMSHRDTETSPNAASQADCLPSTVQHPFQISALAPEAPQLRWTKIFQMQHSEGYWELTPELGELVDFNVDLFANEFLKNKGIRSLGVRAHTDILRLVASLLVLQLMRVQSLKEGKLLRTLFSLKDWSQPGPRPERWKQVKRAVDWVRWADHQYPCVYSRLEFGVSWETSTRQLLGFEGLPPFSALRGLKLQRTNRQLLVF